MLPYKDNSIEFCGETFKVLDTAKLNFENCPIAIKCEHFAVFRAKGGEVIETRNANGLIESITTAKRGDAIFMNENADQYIPRNPDGTAWQFDNIENHGYFVLDRTEDGIMVESQNKALVMIGAIQEPTCIFEAFGPGSHQFLYEGATLKLDINTHTITGIDKTAFERTWTVLTTPESEK